MKDLYVYMFCSRNKDNKDTVENFKERTKTIIDYEENEDKVLEAFDEFVKKGLPNEESRLYKSCNRRNEEVVQKELIIRLLRDNPPINKLKNTLASVAQNKKCALDNKWFFDFDEDDLGLLCKFQYDIIENSNLTEDDIEVSKTKNGYAVIVNHGFDTRELLEKYKDYDITLKRDDLILKEWKKNK